MGDIIAFTVTRPACAKKHSPGSTRQQHDLKTKTKLKVKVVVVVMMEGPDKWRPHVRKAVCKKQTVFLKKSLFLFATCSMAHRSNYTFRTRARSQPNKKRSQDLAPGHRVSHTVWSIQNEPILGHLLQDFLD